MAESEIKQRPSHIVDKEEKKSLVIRKICDLEDRVHDLEEQGRKSKKALETALQQNNYLEKCIRNLETKLTENEKRAKNQEKFREEILDFLDTLQNFEVRVSLLETRHMDVEGELRSVKAEVSTNTTTASSKAQQDMKVNTLLNLVKQYDESREKQAAKQNKRIDACEAKLESLVNNKPTGTSGNSTGAILPPPPAQNLSDLQGNPLQYQQPPGLQYHVLPMAPHPQVVMTPQPQGGLDTFDMFSVEIEEAQYSDLVGCGGKNIDLIRQNSGATITIKELRDNRPKLYYEVLITGTSPQVKLATQQVLNNKKCHLTQTITSLVTEKEELSAKK